MQLCSFWEYKIVCRERSIPRIFGPFNFSICWSHELEPPHGSWSKSTRPWKKSGQWFRQNALEYREKWSLKAQFHLLGRLEIQCNECYLKLYYKMLLYTMQALERGSDGKYPATCLCDIKGVIISIINILEFYLDIFGNFGRHFNSEHSIMYDKFQTWILAEVFWETQNLL